MTSEAVVYTSTSVLFVLALTALVYLCNFIWMYSIKQGINKKFVSLFNLVAFLLLGAIIASTIIIFIYVA